MDSGWPKKTLYSYTLYTEYVSKYNCNLLTLLQSKSSTAFVSSECGLYIWYFQVKFTQCKWNWTGIAEIKKQNQSVKCVRIRCFSGTYFPASWHSSISTYFPAYGVSLHICFHIQSEHGKTRTGKTPNMGTFYAASTNRDNSKNHSFQFQLYTFYALMKLIAKINLKTGSNEKSTWDLK